MQWWLVAMRPSGETNDALARDGRAGAARAFLERAAGPGTWDALPDRVRAFLASEGGGAVADAGMTGLDPDGLGSIACPVTILTGAASERFYAPIADARIEQVAVCREAIHLQGAVGRVDYPVPGDVGALVDEALVALVARGGAG